MATQNSNHLLYQQIVYNNVLLCFGWLAYNKLNSSFTPFGVLGSGLVSYIQIAYQIFRLYFRIIPHTESYMIRERRRVKLKKLELFFFSADFVQTFGNFHI